ncbi:HD-GYP domain-containing protein [Desulfovibrio sp. SGI.169]|uniref:HD-GYP domain-containing protein n=1 Tax=Desulfovibrio sp. SGI.169 TaxID=3420561 RepID=UPI003CFBE6FC
MIESLSTAIEFRSGESGAHIRKIHDITKLFLESSPLGNNFSTEEIEHISLAAVMHDVGKISIPDAILNKRGRLTPEEFEVMKTHTTEGGQLLEKIPQMKELPFFSYAYDIAKYHHERWDGRGYPEGLKGDDIPLWAQIVSIADVYDALVSPRCYKKAFSFEVSLGMIVGGECGVFNPQILTSFQEIEPRLRSLYDNRSE